MELSVCICTFNRAPLLQSALAAMARARPPEAARWELLVVDNNSVDDTAEVVARFNSRLPLRYLTEEKQGLSHARNRACEECRGELLVFSDDDVQVDAEWLRTFARAAERLPDARYFGGRVLPDWSAGRPAWLLDEDLALLSGLIVKYDLGNEERDLTGEDPPPFGASFGIRRSLFEALAPFRGDLGPVGDVPGRGDDAEYLERARRSGATGVYLAGAVSYHWVDPSRFKMGYLYRFGVEKGAAHSKLTESASRGSRVRELGFLFRGLVQLAKGRGDRFRQCVINMGIEAGLRRQAVTRPAPP